MAAPPKRHPSSKGRKPPVVHETARTVGVRELRQNLSVYLERVKRGEALTVTEHGREVAMLRPMPKTRDPIERLIAEGKAKPPRGDILALGPPLKIKLDKPLSQVLQEMRDEEEF